jgi:hypothetical protein
MGVLSPPARPATPKFVTHAQLAWTLRVRDHGRIVRTVRFNLVDPLTAGDLAAWQKKAGFWEVDFFGKGPSESLRLCPHFCGDVEPGYASFGAPFNNVRALRTAPAAGRIEIVLEGSITVNHSASITAVSANVWVCPGSVPLSVSCAKGRGGFDFDTPTPIAVVAGEQVLFTLDMKVPAERG